MKSHAKLSSYLCSRETASLMKANCSWARTNCPGGGGPILVIFPVARLPSPLLSASAFHSSGSLHSAKSTSINVLHPGMFNVYRHRTNNRSSSLAFDVDKVILNSMRVISGNSLLRKVSFSQKRSTFECWRISTCDIYGISTTGGGRGSLRLPASSV